MIRALMALLLAASTLGACRVECGKYEPCPIVDVFPNKDK